MFELQIDMQEVERAAEALRGATDQIPYVMSSILNTAAFATRGSLVKETWPQHVKQRALNFPSVVLYVDKATKDNLTVSISENRDSTAPLQPHADGGVKQAAKRFAIPMPDYREGKMTARGLRKNSRARAIIERTPKRALRITSKGIFIGEQGRLRLAFVFKQSVTIPKDVPFHEDFDRHMREGITTLFEPKMAQAMRTRR
jgi:hypothetical protein